MVYSAIARNLSWQSATTSTSTAKTHAHRLDRQGNQNFGEGQSFPHCAGQSLILRKPDPSLHALVDWDNIEDRDRRSGPKYVADRLWQSLTMIAGSIMAPIHQLDLRLYGGWRGRNSPSQRASQLEALIQLDFPFVLRDQSRADPVRINGELAQALARLPREILPHTFRERQGPPKLQCQNATQLGCTLPMCPIDTVRDLFTRARCPEQSCTRTIDQVILRSEQKLVDTMLVSDLIHFSGNGESVLAVVSSDDDLWPGILTALDLGTHVIHVGPKSHSSHQLYVGAAHKRRYSHGKF